MKIPEFKISIMTGIYWIIITILAVNLYWYRGMYFQMSNDTLALQTRYSELKAYDKLFAEMETKINQPGY